MPFMHESARDLLIFCNSFIADLALSQAGLMMADVQSKLRTSIAKAAADLGTDQPMLELNTDLNNTVQVHILARSAHRQNVVLQIWVIDQGGVKAQLQVRAQNFPATFPALVPVTIIHEVKYWRRKEEDISPSTNSFLTLFEGVLSEFQNGFELGVCEKPMF